MKEVKYFICRYLTDINRGLENRDLNADNVINICWIQNNENFVVFYKENEDNFGPAR